MAYPVWYRCYKASGSSTIVFSVLFGWLFVTAATWWLAVLQVPLSFFSAWLAILLLLVTTWFLYKKRYRSLPEIPSLKTYMPFCIWFVFLAGLYLYLRSFRPEINSLEKFPDMAMIFSIFKGGVVPPLDPFTAGETINYYYLGHFQSALFSKLLFLQPNEFFHYHVASLFALTIMAIYSISVMLLNHIIPVKDKSLNYLCGGLASLLGVIAGNFQAFYETIIMGRAKFWYPDATRYIDKTIHEFPSYSFIVGDLHGHLMNMPFTILCFSLAVLWSRRLEKFVTESWKFCLQQNWLFLALIGFVTASSYLINAWDIFTLLLLVGFVSWFSVTKDNKFFHPKVLKFLFAMSLFLVLCSILFYFPYWIWFHPPASGLELVPPDKSSPFLQLLIIWIIHLFFPAIYLLFSNKFRERSPVLFSISLLSLLLVIFLEITFFKDIYPDHFRANTMFKIGIQIWFWGSISTSVIFTLILAERVHWWKWTRYTYMAIAGVLLGAGLYYTLRAVPQSFGLDHKSSLDGMSFLRKSDPDSYELVLWLRKNTQNQPVVLEAVGESFSQYGRIAVFTGLPSVLQWPIHVWLWRGSYDQSFIPKSKVELNTGTIDSVISRKSDVEEIYETKDFDKTRYLLKKYDVQYVVIGLPERKIYENIYVDKFENLGKVIFEHKSIKLYKIH